MRKFILSIFLTFVCFTTYTYSQNIINVPAADINSISTAISGAAAGDILVLERDGIYLFQGRLDVAVPLTIRAAEGSGKRPLLQQIPTDLGTYAGDPDVQISADLTLENIHFNGSRGPLRTISTGRAIRYAADNLKLVVDGCVFERYWLRTIDLNAFVGCKLFYKNSLHLWDGREDRIDNGRFIDTRGSSIDSLVVVNNTFLNCNDRFIRNMGLPGIITFAKFDHNTFYGNIGYRPPFQFRTTKELVFTNNVVANVGLLGTDTLSNRKDEVGYADPAKTICIFTVTGTDTLNTTIDMKNNVVFTESRFTELFAINPLAVQPAPLFNKEWLDRITLSEAVIDEQLTFVKAPSLDSLRLDLGNYINGGTNWSNTGFTTRTEVLTPEEVNMSYGKTAAAYTAADGYPAGDLNWYPAMKAQWEQGVDLTGLEELNGLPSDYSLEQNYPNPFNPSTDIKFNIPQSGFVTLSVYNVLGQKITELVNGELSAGSYNYNFDASNLASGIYLYTITTNNFTQSKKMMLLK